MGEHKEGTIIIPPDNVLSVNNDEFHEDLSFMKYKDIF